MSRARIIAILLVLSACVLSSPHPPLRAEEDDEPRPRSIAFEEERETADEVTILGLAGVHHAVARGTILLYDDQGRLLDRLGPRDHRAGYFELPLSGLRLAHLAGPDEKLDFRIVLRNGRSEGVRGPVSLVADVRDFDPRSDIVYLNPVTTLISIHLDRHPDLTLEQATAAVREHFEVPDHIEIGRDITVGTHVFDGEVFLDRAAAYPGGSSASWSIFSTASA